jgi:hypothetical protein
MSMLASRYIVDKTLPSGSLAAKNPEGIYAQRVNHRDLQVAAPVLEFTADCGLTPGQL